MKDMIYAVTELEQIQADREKLLQKAANILAEVIRNMTQNGGSVTANTINNALKAYSDVDKVTILTYTLTNLAKSKITNTSSAGARKSAGNIFNGQDW